MPHRQRMVRLGGGGGAAPDPLRTGLVAYWRLDEASGTRYDAVGSSHLSDSNTVGSAAGKLGSAARFVAANSTALICASGSALSPGDSDFTIGAWVYWSGSSTETVMAKFGGAAGLNEYCLDIAGSRFRFYVSADGTNTTILTATTFGTVPTSTWVFVVAWHDSVADTINIQVNNGTVNSASHASGLHQGAQPFSLGYRGAAGNNHWTGLIDTAFWYQRTLTTAERTRLWNSGDGLIPPGVASPVMPPDVAGVWSWWTYSSAVCVADATYIGWVNPLGSVIVGKYHHATRQVTVFNLNSKLEVDDHNPPSLLLRASDQRILAAYNKHNDTNLRLRISTNPEDISAWGAEANLDAALGGNGYAYASLVQLTDEPDDPIYLFYRGTDGTGSPWWYSVSTDGGVTWAAQTKLVGNGAHRPYTRMIPNGNGRIDFITNDGHPNEVSGNSLYHCYYEAGAYHTSDGTVIGGGLPLAPSSMTKIYDGTTVESWSWDLSIDDDGHPVVVFATFPNPATDHRYHYARWSGSAWNVVEVCTAGPRLYAAETYYSGGIAIDQTNVNCLYASRNTGTQWEMWRYDSGDDGATWTGTQLTFNSAHPNIRPIVPRNAAADLPVVWLRGRYATYTDYDTRVIGV